MKTIAYLALAALAPVWLANVGLAQSVTTDPVGFHTITINPGLRTVGLPLVRPSVAAGGIQSSTASVVTGSSATVNYGGFLDASTAYYLEITSDSSNSYVGDRFDVNATATIASANNTVTIDTASANNSTLGSLPDLSGCNFVIRPHITIGYIFGTKGNTPMQGSTSVSSADQIQLYNNALGGFEIYFLLRNPTGTIEEWRKIGGGTTKYDDLVIPPGVGMFVQRNGATPVTLTPVGEVRTVPFFAQNLKPGLNLVSEGFPIDNSPVARDCTAANGWSGSTSLSTSDQFHVYNPSLGGYEIYYLLKSGTIEQWRKVGGGTTNFAATNIFSLDGAFFIRKVTAQPAYAEPKPF